MSLSKLENTQPLFVIMGATASGKSSLALKLAQDLNGEIITADSMQVYRGMDIGTAKPTQEDQHLVPHHLIDIVDINDRVDVFMYVERAEQCIAEIRSRGKLPILAGGTGMYIRALLYGLDQMPADQTLRKKLDELYDHDEGYEDLKVLMAEKDPVDFKRWHMHRRKLIRALEVFELTGQSITELQKVWEDELRMPAVVWNLHWDRVVQRERIFERTAQMLEQGWIDEAKHMIESGVFESPTAHQVLGYKFISMYLNGEIDYDEMVKQIATKTWQLARRQRTWFKTKHPEAEVIEMPAGYDVLLARARESLGC